VLKKFLLILLFAVVPLQKEANSSHLSNQKELIVTSESTNESLALAKYLKNKGVIKYSAYWCPNCLHQSELFGKQAYKELNVVECARDGKNSQTQLCIDKKIEGFPSWEINGKIILGIQTLQELSNLTGYKK
tara:strand:+ start:144 stop:539 length:396 start_codon:yes stop_codon:yes gene_type:complete